jgi:hypothetical protein
MANVMRPDIGLLILQFAAAWHCEGASSFAALSSLRFLVRQQRICRLLDRVPTRH